MNFTKYSISYPQTGYCTGTVTDYLQRDDKLKSFYQHFPTEEGINKAIEARQKYPADRELLSKALCGQYETVETDAIVSRNIQLLKQEDTFTITTAHQPNLFTGPLYFIYKILHTIKLAAFCKQRYPAYNFVPVYFMGSEDADIDELGHIFLNEKKLEWQTGQTGAVGRMIVDDELVKLITRIAAEVNVLPHGPEMMECIRKYYQKGAKVQEAIFGLINHLFGKYGLVVLIPDNAQLKSVAVNVFKDELLNQQSSKIIEGTVKRLREKGYRPQAHGRDINLFYLADNIRARIERVADQWKVVDTDIVFDQAGLLKELETHPESFSPNVILRGLFQEMILPNLIFIGGGGELAYWLELKDIFERYAVPYPVLILRNSFLLVDKKQSEKINKLGFKPKDLFAPVKTLQDVWIQENGSKNIAVDDSLAGIRALFENLSEQAAAIDTTLRRHIYALQKQTEKRITDAGKKFLRAEKRNHTDAMRQIEKLKKQLFPFNNLQERVDNIIAYYARWGNNLVDVLYENSFSLEQEFVILTED